MIPDTDRSQSGACCDMRPRKRSNAGSDIIVPILRSGILARECCRRGRHAEVEAVFERSIYLRSGDMFVCIGEPSIGNGPLTLIADLGGARPLTSLGLFPGQPASMSDRCIAIGDKVRLTLDRCVLWRQPPWPASLPLSELNDLRSAIAHRMTFEAPRESLARVYCRPEGGAESPLTRISRPRIARFESWLLGALDRSTPSPAPVAELIGLGPGLTPSGDDFLVGALALLDALAARRAHEALARAITDLARRSTSALSECLLKTAAAGHFGEDLCCAVSAVVTGKPDQAVAAIRKIGHSSGWDMMAGILTTLHAVTTAPSPLPANGEGWGGAIRPKPCSRTEPNAASPIGGSF
jgi:Protein of unknown function (DUF2877)